SRLRAVFSAPGANGPCPGFGSATSSTTLLACPLLVTITSTRPAPASAAGIRTLICSIPTQHVAAPELITGAGKPPIVTVGSAERSRLVRYSHRVVGLPLLATLNGPGVKLVPFRITPSRLP